MQSGIINAMQLVETFQATKVPKRADQLQGLTVLQLKVTMQSVKTKQTVRVQLLASQRVVEGAQGRLAKKRLFRCVAEAGHRKPRFCFASCLLKVVGSRHSWPVWCCVKKVFVWLLILCVVVFVVVFVKGQYHVDGMFQQYFASVRA